MKSLLLSLAVVATAAGLVPVRAQSPDVARPAERREVTRELTLDHRYLHLPVKTGAPKRRMSVVVDGETVREFEIELADDPGWWAHLDVSDWRGKKAVLRVNRLPEGSSALRNVVQADDIWAGGTVYREPLRASSTSRPDAAGTTTRMDSSIPRASIICTSSTIPTAGTGGTCTGATP